LLQVSQKASPHAVLQHTPSTQFPDTHWLACAALQVSPFCFFTRQFPEEQYLSEVHCVSSRQPWQVLPWQAAGLQSWVDTGGQLAAFPGQLAGSVTVPALQLWARHCVLADR
jgi:hypothetical protein